MSDRDRELLAGILKERDWARADYVLTGGNCTNISPDEALRAISQARMEEREVVQSRIKDLTEATCRMLAAYRELRSIYGPAEHEAFEQREHFLFAKQVIEKGDHLPATPKAVRGEVEG